MVINEGFKAVFPSPVLGDLQLVHVFAPCQTVHIFASSQLPMERGRGLEPVAVYLAGLGCGSPMWSLLKQGRRTKHQSETPAVRVRAAGDVHSMAPVSHHQLGRRAAHCGIFRFTVGR